MANTNFVDYVKVYASAGNGGAGAVHFRRARSVPKGGPDGGDGGRGGHIILQGNVQLTTLLHLRYLKQVKAGPGQPGGRSMRTGSTGRDVVLQVPLGTIAKEVSTGQVILEIIQEGIQKILMKGGRGGLGNVHFKSATQQTPRYAQPGESGEEAWVVLELRLLADVGLIGLPNSGKSTLLSVMSAAKPKIGAYPFTTLEPQLGLVNYLDRQSFVMADIPGIIEGAATGKGLGTRFLKHIEHNTVLLFVIAADTPDISRTYATLVKELQTYNPKLLDKPRLLAISKVDLLNEKEKLALASTLPAKVEYVCISALTKQGNRVLKDKIWKLLYQKSRRST